MNLIKSLPKLLGLLKKPLASRSNPENIQIDITTSCNLKCKMCTRYALEESERSRNLPVEQYKKIIDEVRPGSVNLAATGEPFLHSGFFEMVRYARAVSGAVTITSSNFTVVNDKTIQEIIASGLDILKVSIDSPERATYKNIRGQDYLPAVIDNIEKLQKAKQSAGSVTPSVRVDFVIMKENFMQMRQMIDLASRMKIDALQFRLLHTGRVENEVRDELLTGFDVECMIGEMKKAERYSRQIGIKTNLADLLRHEEYIWLYYGSKPAYKLKRRICLLPWLQIFISVSGDVSPCCTLYPSGKKQEGGTGNLPAEGLSNVWNGEKMRALRKMFKAKRNYEVFKGCAKCNPMGFYSLIESLKMFPGIIKIKK